MLKNYFKIAIRQLSKYKFYTFINISGLAIGVAFCLLIVIYIKNETSYDMFHQNAENIYRVAIDINLNQSNTKGTALPEPAARTLKTDFPEIINSGNLNPYLFNAGNNLMRIEGTKQNVSQDKFVYVDQGFTEIFDFIKISGDQKTWLNKPYTLIITKRIADTFFPDSNPIGKNLILNEDPKEQKYTITGVVENLRDDSHFDYNYFLSSETLSVNNDAKSNWVSSNYFTYVQLKEGTKPEGLSSRLYNFGLKYFGPQYRAQLKIDLNEALKSGSKYNLFLQPLSEIHLFSEGFTPQIQTNGDIRYVRIFGAIALFLLIIAVVNFVNLSTAQSANRAKEVGMRKVLGAFHKQLVGQFLTESIIICLFSFGLGLALANILIPFFNSFLEKNLSIPYGEVWFIPSFILATIITGVLSGLYPAFYLSGFRPIKVLKGKFSMGAKSNKLRKSLVVFQFVISISLIIGTIVVSYQMKFIQDKKIGFDREQVMLIQDTYSLGDKVSLLKKELQKLSEVKSAAVSSYLPLDGGRRNSMMYHQEGKSEALDQTPIQQWIVDANYVETLGIKIKEGRNFSEDRPTDSLSVIINETAVRKLGISNPLGKRIKNSFSDNYFTIIAVVEDFNYESLKDEVGGLCMLYGNSISVISLKTNTQNIENLITKANGIWNVISPDLPFKYSFLNERFDKMYVAENRASGLFLILSFLAIFIACLGLFGLITFTAEQRTREIGIRKILGSSVKDIVLLISKDFIKLILIAIVIAMPLAYYFMDKWLLNFVYHINFEWWIFALAGLTAIGIALLTLSFQSIKAALKNPIDSLRND